jgi:hypothetical protein
VTLREEHGLRVFENRVLTRIYGPRMDEIIGGWRKLHNTKLHDFYFLPNTIVLIKSSRLRYPWRVVRIRMDRNVYKLLMGNPEGKRLLERLDVDVKIIFKWILEQEYRKLWTGLTWLRIRTSGGLL